MFRCVVIVAGASLALAGCGNGAESDSTSAVSASAAAPSSSAVASPPASSPSVEVPASGGASGSTSPSTATEAATTPARPGSAEVPVDPAGFRNTGGAGEGYFLTSPSGNVSCGLFPNGSTAGFVGCQAVTSVPPDSGPTCSNADNDKYAVRVEPTGAVHFCTTQGIYTAQNAPVLKYGQILTVGDASCVSREEGISCLLANSNAFVLSRDANQTY